MRQYLVENAQSPNIIYRELLPRYSLSDIEAALRWLEVCEYISYTGIGIAAPRMLIELTDKGVRFAQVGQLDSDDRRLVYQIDPYAAFVARQFRSEDDHLFSYLHDFILGPIGIVAYDGLVDGVEAFRGEIIRKIRDSRFFICILTHRQRLSEGKFASSVWLYQETGAAVALGKKPLILVEEGMDEHYAGELQKNYEYILFSRANFKEKFREVGRRLLSDLMANNIPIRDA